MPFRRYSHGNAVGIGQSSKESEKDEGMRRRKTRERKATSDKGNETDSFSLSEIQGSLVWLVSLYRHGAWPPKSMVLS